MVLIVPEHKMTSGSDVEQTQNCKEEGKEKTLLMAAITGVD